MKNKKIIYSLITLIIILIISTGILIFNSIESEKERVKKQIEMDIVYNELDSISILLGDKILTISQLGGEIDSLIIIKENLEKEKKDFRSRAYSQINRLQNKVDGYKELLIAQDDEIKKLKSINEQLFKENNDQKVEINTLNDKISTINETKETLQEKVNYASRIELNNVEIFGVSKNNKRFKNSFRNRLINKIIIDIEISENEIAKIEVIDIYIRIEKPDGSVMYDISKGSGSFTYENRELFYSLKKEILIDKSVKSFSVEYQKNEDFTLGKHTITFYTNSYIIGKKEFLVK
jgi:hypothetical protein|tara:strand:+ start:150 stop:1028 length:879 start_codon:yes stop_codon:yes gene_type:complete